MVKFAREQRIVEYHNRGVSVAEIAARVGVGEKRMGAIIREVLARRMPHPPEAEFPGAHRAGAVRLAGFGAPGDGALRLGR